MPRYGKAMPAIGRCRGASGPIARAAEATVPATDGISRFGGEERRNRIRSASYAT
jgi:hypothetical protein